MTHRPDCGVPSGRTFACSCNAIRDIATVTVTEPVDGTRRRRRVSRSDVASPVTTIVVDPDVWAQAMRLADGEAQRIEVRSATDVTVHNGPWRNRKKGIPA